MRAGFDDDLLELAFGDEPALGVHGEFKRGFFDRLLADGAGCDLDVLLADGVDDVTGGQAACGGLVGVDPNTHGIFPAAEDLHLTDSGQPREFILYIERGVVAQVDLIVAVVGREQMHDECHVG